jgi:hypothetical protein
VQDTIDGRWVTATDCPAMVNVPVRSSRPVWDETETLTAPDPMALAPPVIAIHPLSDTAVQAQFAPVVTVTEPDPPGPSNESVAGATVYEHGTGAGSFGDRELQAITMTASTRSSAEDHVNCRDIGHLTA